MKWFRSAAEQGHAKAQKQLFFMWALGEGVPKDYIYAHMWANLAAASGDEQAAELRDKKAKQMTSAQIAKAQRLAAECAEKIRKKEKGCETKY